ncbi:hypothetical protein B9T31_12005 [Acinetobacter sp. ANC 4558]|uniref:hypothetical protein n=1 Tax=Acinetobacter sp. ANC 4558 TaxID=1977876 RepID=UPI000A357707|nr:hypothetical protein [Acinetobacter sp. ANC 4558]OTG85509.1 hypothetical protein B9T31_12005 [Acinetobacter sp. ANC 4558]
MSLDYTHKPNYFLYAQLIIRHIETYIEKHPDVENAIFDMRDIYDLFRQDKASITTNLDGILNIADGYTVETIDGDKKLISKYAIDIENNALLIDFDPEALQSLKDGKSITPPDASTMDY